MNDSEQASAPEIIGYCDTCKKPIARTDPYEVVRFGRGGQHIFCPSCYAARNKAIKETEYREEHTKFRNSMIWAGIAAAILVIAAVALAVSTGDMTYLALLGAAAAAFMFVSQCFWTSYALDLLLFFCRSFRLPGLIFTLDLDGIVWLLTVKLIGAVLCAVLSAVLFLVGLAVALVVGVVTFPFCLTREVRHLKALRRSA